MLKTGLAQAEAPVSVNWGSRGSWVEWGGVLTRSAVRTGRLRGPESFRGPSAELHRCGETESEPFSLTHPFTDSLNTLHTSDTFQTGMGDGNIS